MKLLVIVAVLCSSFAFAGCINLNSYQLGSRHSQSEVDSFNSQKLQMYQNYVLSENKITSEYTQKVQRLYQQGLSDSQLKNELTKLEAQKNSRLKANCNSFKSKLNSLLRSFN